MERRQLQSENLYPTMLQFCSYFLNIINKIYLS